MKIKNLTVTLIVALFAMVVLPASAQSLQVYHVVSGKTNKVKYTANGKELKLNEKLTLNTKVTVDYDCKLELLDEANSKRYVINKPGTGTIKELAASNGSVSNLTSKYVAYVKSQMAQKKTGMQSPQQLYDYATVTRTISRKDDAKKKKSDDPFADMAAEFDDFNNKINQEYNDFVARIDNEFTDFVAKAWFDFEGEPAVKRPTLQEIKPQVIENDNEATARLSFKSVLATLKRVMRVSDKDYENDSNYEEEQPQPLEEFAKLNTAKKKAKTDDDTTKKKNSKTGSDLLAELGSGSDASTGEAKEGYMPFVFYGTDLQVRLDESLRFHLGKFEPQRVANVLKGLSQRNFDNVIFDCLQIRKDRHFGDWAYLQMLKSLTDQFCGEETNESAILLGYIAYKSGYKTRFGYDNATKRIFTLFGSKHSIYGKPSYFIDDVRYYGLEELPMSMSLCSAAYPQEKALSLFIPSAQDFAQNESPKRTIASKRYPDFKFSVSVNKNLLNFYNTVPASNIGGDHETQWNTYANTPLATEVRDQIYPIIKKKFEGKTDVQKVNYLLNLIQYGMEYEHDDVVWGVADRIFFPEETLYYPACDCEDRAIFLTRVVRDCIGLPCALVHYEGHLAAAVAFNEPTRGVYWQEDGKKYTVCDPTYIGGNVGDEMDVVDHDTAVLILLP